MFNSIHNLAHVGSRATSDAIAERYIGSFLKRGCAWLCIGAGNVWAVKHGFLGFLDMFSPLYRIIRFQMNCFLIFTSDTSRIIGALPLSRGFRYCLSSIDRYTKWPEVIPLMDQTFKAEAFVTGWISRFGLSKIITADKCRNVKIECYRNLAKTLGYEKARSTAFNPASNGIVERFQTINDFNKLSVVWKIASNIAWLEHSIEGGYWCMFYGTGLWNQFLDTGCSTRVH